MNSFLYAFFMAVLWLINMMNFTALGATYHTVELFQTVIYIMTAILAVRVLLSRRNVGYEQRDILIFGGFGLFIILSSWINGNAQFGIHYLTSFFLVLVLAQFRMDKRTIQYIGIIFLAMGLGVLTIYQFGSALSEWNPNSIAMFGFDSYLIFIIPYFKTKTRNIRFFLILVSVIMVILLLMTDSRSSIVFTSVALLCVVSVIPEKVFTSGNKMLVFWLFFPLIISIITILLADSSIMSGLNNWSRSVNGKLFFNGREILWRNVFRHDISDHPLFGTGKVESWHNSALMCLAAVGVPGFLLWIGCFYRMLNKARPYLNDSIVTGTFVAFLILYCQQAMDMGLFAEVPNIMPYIMLGVMFGRINTIKRQMEERSISEHYSFSVEQTE